MTRSGWTDRPQTCWRSRSAAWRTRRSGCWWPGEATTGLDLLPQPGRAWPWVEIVTSDAGADGRAVRALVAGWKEHGLRGLAGPAAALVAEAVPRPHVAVLVPVLSLLGTIEAGRQVIALAADPVQPAKGDRRFASEEWKKSPYHEFLKQSYLVNARYVNDLIERASLDDRTRARMRFFARQILDALSPSNYLATNPQVIRRAMETGGDSVATGVRNLLNDLGKGRISMTDGRHFQFAAVPLPDGNALFTMVDVTDSSRIEAALRERG